MHFWCCPNRDSGGPSRRSHHSGCCSLNPQGLQRLSPAQLKQSLDTNDSHTDSCIRGRETPRVLQFLQLCICCVQLMHGQAPQLDGARHWWVTWVRSAPWCCHGVLPGNNVFSWKAGSGPQCPQNPRIPTRCQRRCRLP